MKGAVLPVDLTGKRDKPSPVRRRELAVVALCLSILLTGNEDMHMDALMELLITSWL
jgi:hypothetical protein